MSTPNLGLTINTSLGGNMNIRNLSPRFNNYLSSSPKQEYSRVVLLLKNQERRRVTEKYITNLGIKVTVVEKWEHLSYAVEKHFGFSPQSSMERAECSSRELPLIGMDDIDSRSQLPKRRNCFSPVVLLVIDAKTGPFLELYDIVTQFRRGLHHGITCKVVWLNEPRTHVSERGDISCLRPLHGSSLIEVLKMLPEFGGTRRNETPTELLRHSFVAEVSPKHRYQEEGPSSRFNKNLGKAIMAQTASESETSVKSVHTDQKPIGNPEDEEETSKPSNDKFLRGKRVLVVDDCIITSKVVTVRLKKMGVSEVKQCYSGKEAVRLVTERLTQREQVNKLPFDYIFMDCHMPEMDGYEATREIRKVEKSYGVHIPIIAVSGHDLGSREARETIEAGMDAFLEKELKQDQLTNVIKEIESKMTLHTTL